MYAEERQQAILRRLRSAGRVAVATLVDEFEVTGETVRRDLNALERRGVARRVHGGAVPMDWHGTEPAVGPRRLVMREEKLRIAQAALAELPEDGTILLDGGTTTARLAADLPPHREFTVVTHSLDIAYMLSRRPNVTVMLTGGRLRSRTMTTVDEWALHAVRDTYVEVAFIATNGISVGRGLTTPDAAEATVKRAAIASSRRCVLLADHSKVDHDYFSRFADLCDVDTFITDRGIDPAAAARIGAAGPRIVLA